MRGRKSIAMASIVVSMGFCAAAVAAPAAGADVSCYKLGSEVSALIDKSAASTNLPAARAAFQAGIMDCMEGDDAAANAHYREAKSLLIAEAPARVSVPAAEKTRLPAEADCQKLGGEVSALIDKSGASRNLPLARAKFQAGIMQCMEGDDASANKLYQDARALLTE